MKLQHFSPTLALIVALNAATTMAESSASNATPSCCSKDAVPAQSTDKSLFQVESKWTTDAGAEIKLGALAGRPQVLVMFFAKCQFACPILVNDMKRIEAALPENLRTNIGFTLVSFDSKRDTPAALAKYRELHALSADRWKLLRGKPGDVLELAALLGVKFKQDARGDFAHSNVITILNSQGEIVHQQIGLNDIVAETVRVLGQLGAKSVFENPSYPCSSRGNEAQTSRFSEPPSGRSQSLLTSAATFQTGSK